MDSIISISKVNFSYQLNDGEGTKQVIRDLSLDIERGKVTAIIGRNGSGKSTLAKLCNGIILPDDGTVTIDGMLTCDEEHAFDIKKKIGMVFQNPDNQLVATICEEDVAFGPENLGVPSAEIRERVDKALAAVGMSEYAKSEPHRLSGGQKQRIAIAGVLAMQPECIIFDEATAMLDPYGRAEVLAVTERLKQSGITVVMITHYMEEACLADNVVVIYDGTVLSKGKPEEIFSSREIMEKAGLCPPQNIELTHKLCDAGMKIPVSLSIDETAENIGKALLGE